MIKTTEMGTGNMLNVAGEELTNVLINIGIFPNVTGYFMLKDLTMLMLFGTSKQNMSTAYFELSKKIGRSPACIERSIRFAIAQAHNVGKLSKINSLLGANIVEKNYCLTNSQLVGLLAELISRRLSRSLGQY